MFAALDVVFENDTLKNDAMRRKSLGEIYRIWKKCRKAMDPDFNSKRFREKALFGKSMGRQVKITRGGK